MPLILIPTPASSAANTYADVATAIARTAFRVGGQAFLTLTSDQQAQTLFTATENIDSLEGYPGFIGERYSADQALAFPRDDAELPAALVIATIELAMSYAPAFATGYAGGDVLNQNRQKTNVKRKKTGSLETEWFSARGVDAISIESLPDIVQRYLSSLLLVIPNAVLNYGTGTVVRSS